jgi:hypothetical protein
MAIIDNLSMIHDTIKLKDAIQWMGRRGWTPEQAEAILVFNSSPKDLVFVEGWEELASHYEPDNNLRSRIVRVLTASDAQDEALWQNKAMLTPRKWIAYWEDAGFCFSAVLRKAMKAGLTPRTKTRQRTLERILIAVCTEYKIFPEEHKRAGIVGDLFYGRPTTETIRNAFDDAQVTYDLWKKKVD